MKPFVFTSLNSLDFPRSILPRCCFALCSSLNQLGCWGTAAFGFGESGLLIAFSSQLDLEGLHRLLGLGGMLFSCSLSSSTTSCSSEKELTSLLSIGAGLTKLALDSLSVLGLELLWPNGF